MENKKVVPVPEVYGWKHNEIPKIPIYKSERTEVHDEWDTEAIKNASNKEGESHD